MLFSHRRCLLVCLLTLHFGSQNSVAAAEVDTRTFPAQKCRFTLPGPEWSWLEVKAPNLLFMVKSTKEYIINLVVVSVPKPLPMNEVFAKEFEKSYYMPGQIERRGSRFVIFQGVPCFQTEGILANGRTTATCVFNGHGLFYTLIIIGAKEPIEDDPAFEKLLEGFEFTIPPEQTAKPIDTEAVQQPAAVSSASPPVYSAYQNTPLIPLISAWMGRIAAVCILGAVLLLVWRWLFGKRKAGKPKSDPIDFSRQD